MILLLLFSCFQRRARHISAGLQSLPLLFLVFFFDCKDTKKNSICKNNFGFSTEDAKTPTKA